MKLKNKPNKELKRLMKKDKFPSKDTGITISKVNIDAPYTVVILSKDSKEYMGVSKCSALDTFDAAIGQSIAMSRALKKMDTA